MESSYNQYFQAVFYLQKSNYFQYCEYIYILSVLGGATYKIMIMIRLNSSPFAVVHAHLTEENLGGCFVFF